MSPLWAEAFRLRLMRGLELRLAECGFAGIAGVDEAGRGCLAGPVVAAAVVTETDRMVPGVDDSKSLNAEKREALAAEIRRVHPNHAVSSTSAQEIDRINILEATRQAMSKALARLDPVPEIAIVDAVRLPTMRSGQGNLPMLPLVRGDQISYAVACASILAKVDRDAYMRDLDRIFPQYGFASNKGYGAPKHRQALTAHGPSTEHRLTFRSVLPQGQTALSRAEA